MGPVVLDESGSFRGPCVEMKATVRVPQGVTLASGCAGHRVIWTGKDRTEHKKAECCDRTNRALMWDVLHCSWEPRGTGSTPRAGTMRCVKLRGQTLVLRFLGLDLSWQGKGSPLSFTSSTTIKSLASCSMNNKIQIDIGVIAEDGRSKMASTNAQN